MIERFKNGSGKPYSVGDWLDNHHSIKSRLRFELAQSLPVHAGNKVLDIGCGTGIWTFLIAELLGHAGTIMGIDLDPEAIALAARRRNSHYLKDCIRFECIDFTKFSPNEKFDIVILFNTLSYFPNPGAYLRNIWNLVRPNGSLIVKDSDLGSDFYWPVDVNLYHRLMSRIAALDGICGDDNYDPFFARKLPGLLRKNGFSNIDLRSQSFSFTYPVDERQRRYIAANGKMISKAALKAGDIAGAEQWANQFENSQPGPIFDNPDFLYSMTEFIFQARVPDSS